MKWLKNLLKRNKKINTNYIKAINRNPKTGKWEYDNNSTDNQALLGVVSPKTCKCQNKCDNCKLEESMNRHPSGKKKTNATNNKTISEPEKSISSNNPLLGENGKTKTTPTGKSTPNKSNGTRKPKETK